MAVTFSGGVQVPAIIGNGDTTQHLFSIENQIGSRVDVDVRSILFQLDTIAALATNTAQVKATRAHTVVEQMWSYGIKVLPSLIKSDSWDFKLRPGESLLLSAIGAAVTTNAALTNNWLIDCAWEEDAKSTFAISGTITLSGSPVSGARVIVMESDDVSGTNMFLRETIVTGAGGTWASSILTGKIGAAFVQYESGGTYYTAPGSPFLS